MRATTHRVKRETKTKDYDYKARHGANPHDIPMGANDVPTVNAVVAFQFHGDEITTFEVYGEPYVAMRRIVENLGMSWPRQSAKLMEQEAKFTCTHMATRDSLGRQQAMLSIPLAKLPLWLASINPNKVPDLQARAKIELYQERSAQALYEYWFKGGAGAVVGYDEELAALRSDVTAIKETLSRVSGMEKMNLHKVTGIERVVSAAYSLDETVARIVDQRLAEDPRRAVIDKVSIRQLLEDAKVPPKGRRSLQRKVFVRLMAWCVENQVPAYQCAHSKTWLFDRPKATWFIRERCAGLISDHLAKYSGQGLLRLVVPKSSQRLAGEGGNGPQ